MSLIYRKCVANLQSENDTGKFVSSRIVVCMFRITSKI